MNTSSNYTHADHARACKDAAEHRQPFKQYVQVQGHGELIMCGVIVDAFDIDESPMWRVDIHSPFKGRLTFPVRRVRKCSGVDGKCTCKNIDN